MPTGPRPEVAVIGLDCAEPSLLFDGSPTGSRT